VGGAGGVGRLAYSGRHGLAVLPVRYKLDQGSIVFRTPLDSPTDEDLRTGIQGAEYKVSFEIDEVGQDAREGWMVIIQGCRAPYGLRRRPRISLGARQPAIGWRHAEAFPAHHPHLYRRPPPPLKSRHHRQFPASATARRHVIGQILTTAFNFG